MMDVNNTKANLNKIQEDDNKITLMRREKRL